MNLTIYVIRDKISGYHCSSSKYGHFDTSMNECAIFRQRKNAEKAMKDVNQRLAQYKCYNVGTNGNNFKHFTTDIDPMDLEVVELHFAQVITQV